MNTTTIRRIVSGAAAVGVLSVVGALPASAEPDPGFHGSTGDPGQAATGDQGTTQVLVDDNALEYLQIGLGALGGMTLAGAAAFGVRRIDRKVPHPA